MDVLENNILQNKSRRLYNYLTILAITRLVKWEIWEHDVNLGYNPIDYPIFSILWLYYSIGKELTIQIKNGKIYENKTKC